MLEIDEISVPSNTKILYRYHWKDNLILNNRYIFRSRQRQKVIFSIKLFFQPSHTLPGWVIYSDQKGMMCNFTCQYAGKYSVLPALALNIVSDHNTTFDNCKIMECNCSKYRFCSIYF